MAERGGFQQFVAHQPKRKRAAVVCVACHEKKIKCDLQEVTTHGYSTCTNCAATGNECRYRQSNRDRRRRMTEPVLPPQESLHHPTRHHLSLIATPPLSTDNSEQSDHIQGSAISTSVDGTLSSFAGDELYQPQRPLPVLVTVSHGHSSQQQQAAKFAVQHAEPLTPHPRNDAADSYLGETGFLEIYGPETRLDADGQVQLNKEKPKDLNLPAPELLQGFEETYFEYCYTWCPVLDRETLGSELEQSPLLVNALAVAGGHVQPPMIHHTAPAVHYDRVKELFYGDKEENLIMCLKAIALIYWWSPRPPSRVHRDSSWWWTTAAIRHCQHSGFHREPRPGNPSRSTIDPGLRRRIWWTLFARERLTALCQDRPCVIDPEDCDIKELSLDDFPEKDIKAEIFIRWVRLCGIIGRVAKHLSRPVNASTPSFPVHLAEDLITWVQSLPENLALPIQSARTTKFNRDIHQMHLPYLAVIIVLHLRRSSQQLPRAYSAAILAASCIARIFKDCLARGRIRYMMAISCWYCGIALLALLQASQMETLVQSAEEDIKILLIALKELRVMWPTANIFIQGYDRLRAHSSSAADRETLTTNTRGPLRLDQTSDDDVSSSNGINWTQYFPHATIQTSGLATELLLEHLDDFSLDENWLGFMSLQPNELFDPFDIYSDAMPDLPAL